MYNQIDTKNSKILKKENLRGVFQSYANPKKESLENKAWQNHVLEKYKSNMND